VLTERIDRALDALDASRKHVPGLRDVYRPQTPERVVLDKLLQVMAEADDVLGRSADTTRRA
jgi:hypothetical protein